MPKPLFPQSDPQESYPDPFAHFPGLNRCGVTRAHLTERATAYCAAEQTAQETFTNIVPDALHAADREQQAEKSRTLAQKEKEDRKETV